jgi:hypothetical protein
MTLEEVTKRKPEPSAEQAAAEELVRRGARAGPVADRPDGLPKQLTKAVLETALDQELTGHLAMRRIARSSMGREGTFEPQVIRKGVIGPAIMLLTACVFGSGIMLAVTGPGDGGSPGGWLQVHRISFIAWAFFIVIHVLAYVWRLPGLLAAEARSGARPEGAAAGSAAARRHARRAMEALGGRGARLALLTASLLAGLVIALLTVHLAGQWERGPGGF